MRRVLRPAQRAMLLGLLGLIMLGLQSWPVTSLAAPAPALPTFSIHTNLHDDVRVTGAQLDQFIRSVRPKSPLIGLGATWVAVGKQYDVNPIYLMAHAIHESSWGTSRIARQNRNLYGWRAYNHCPRSCAARYSSQAAGIRAVVPAINKLYLTPGGRYYTRHGATLYGMNFAYASDRNWKHKIVRLMNQASRQINRN